jgi:hypothetical protein
MTRKRAPFCSSRPWIAATFGVVERREHPRLALEAREPLAVELELLGSALIATSR